MPPKKRQAPAPAEAESSKKARTTANIYKIKRLSKDRWSKVSGSRNVEESYKLLKDKDGEKAWSFITLCQMPFSNNESDDDDEDDEDDEDETDKPNKKPQCDGGKKNCLCQKPAKDHPEHPWIVSRAGFDKFINQRIQVSLRDPDNFDMYTWNDHAGEGALQVLQNLVLDFAELAPDRKEQWAICEAMVMYLLSDSSMMMTTYVFHYCYCSC